MRLGNEAEAAVCGHLQAMGARIVARNWRRPWGEIDIVAETPDGIVHFVEVKAARRAVAGFTPELRADGRKMAKVQRTARTWLAANQYGPATEWQMDVASVIMGTGEQSIEMFWNI
jgi:putative endonuclease